MGQSWSDFNQRRNAKTLAQLAPRKTPGRDSPLPVLGRDVLLAALDNVSVHIAKKKANVTVIAIGGAVNTIYLGTRNATHDVDFFNNRLTITDFEHLIQGAHNAVKHNNNLGEEWFNNRTIFFIPHDQRQTLTNEAFEQGEIIFDKPGLTVLAAPWSMHFAANSID
jgi:hypothetical protein